ncbi:sugar kinase [Maribacter sp. HTCC2170]|uniref:sugar kinase n=1 Tax=Maribacter sp. (strain HTCC2170 / KCCM 42371) TaxID=313603 RepID=UPI00006BD222|nr:sugar kinase [Maribacter sp. HTCC2170]EAR02024.1 PfkB [Maribacter sp. HTCC2170]
MSFVAFGEIMLRLSPADFSNKIRTSQAFDVGYAGSESNVASSLGKLGNQVSYITKLPGNQLGDAAISSIRGFGIDTKYIVKGGNRIGTYFVEIGSSIRPSSVIYDRKGSAISELSSEEFDWEEILLNKKWLFLSGITPVLSEQCALETIKAAEIAKKMGVKVAFDMNYRRSLWNNPADARKIFDKILKHTDLLFGNFGVLKDVYEMQAKGSNISEQTLKVAFDASKKFNVPHIAFTIRKHISASNNLVSAIYISGSKHYISDSYDVEITDRFGTGDAFAAACLHAINHDWKNDDIINFGAAAFALKHTIKGDQHTSDEKEILSIMIGNAGGYVLR